MKTKVHIGMHDCDHAHPCLQKKQNYLMNLTGFARALTAMQFKVSSQQVHNILLYTEYLSFND